jgi:hypothetical protein
MLSGGNRIHNFILCVCETFVIPFYYCTITVINYDSGSDFLTSYSSGSGPHGKKLRFQRLRFRFRFHNTEYKNKIRLRGE